MNESEARAASDTDAVAGKSLILAQSGGDQPARPARRRFNIELPDPLAFNGSLLPLGDGFLLVYRSAVDGLSACHLDRNYRMVPGSHSGMGISRNVDPRLVRTDAAVFMSCSYWDGAGLESERIELWTLSRLSPTPAVGPRLAFGEGLRGDPAYCRRREKNWAPFVADGEFFYVHEVLPHRILRVDFAAMHAALVYDVPWACPWWKAEWGREFRGNTPPARLADGSFLSTFHTVSPAGGGYHTGFYRFDGAPPFRVLEASAAPVFSPADATGENPRDAARRCVFPLSLQVEGDLLRVAGGDNDHSVVVYHLSLPEVTAGLIPAVPPVGDERCQGLAAAITRAHAVLALTDRQILADALQAPDARADWIASNRTYAWHYAIGQVLRPRRVGEIGVRFGYSLKALALGTSAGGSAHPAVWGWDGEADGITSNEIARHVLMPVASPVQIRQVNTADLATLDVQGLDVFHVDGDHTESGAGRDMELAWAALRPGGVLLVDDCDFIPAVRRAVDAFCLRRGLARRFLPTFRGTALVVKPESE